jgi:hypothetical protein
VRTTVKDDRASPEPPQPAESAAAPVPATSPLVAPAAPLTPHAVLALQRGAGNAAMTAMLQRDFLGDAWDATVGAGSMAARALALGPMLHNDPTAGIAELTQIAWDDVPDPVRARAIDMMLDTVEFAVRNGSPMQVRYIPLMTILRHAALGFIAKVRTSYSDEQKIAVVTRVINLWSHPTGSFERGFGAGLALGLWDGVSGPFVLLWDLLKLEVKLRGLMLDALAALADDDKRREIVAFAEAAYGRVAPLVEKAIDDLMSGKVDGFKLLDALGELADAVLGLAEGIGGEMADALMRHMMNASDEELGHNLGRIEGNLLFELILTALTAGGYAVLKEAVTGARIVTQALERLNEIRQGIRATEAAELLATSLARFSAFIRGNRVLAPIAEGLEEVWNLIVRFIKISYGLEGGAERAGQRTVSVEAHTLEEGVRHARELPGGGVLKLLEDGRIVVCHSPCMYLEQRFARELAGESEEALRWRQQIEQIRRDEQAAIAAGTSEEPAFEAAFALNQELERVRIRGLQGTSGLDEAVLRELLLEANDNGPRLEKLLEHAENDAGRVRQFLRYCGRDEMTFEHMLQGAENFKAPPEAPPAMLQDPALLEFHPNQQANTPHFLDEHTFKHFDVAKIGNSPNKTFWPKEFGQAEVDGKLLEALQKLKREGNLGPRGQWWNRVVDIEGFVVQVGSNPNFIGQFFPIGGARVLVYGNEELRVIARLFGRPA